MAFSSDTQGNNTLFDGNAQLLAGENKGNFSHCYFKGNVLQQVGNDFIADNTLMEGNKVKLESVGIQNTLQVKSHEFTMGNLRKIGNNSELIADTNILKRTGTQNLGKTAIRSHLNSREVNKLLSDEHFKADELKLITDKSVHIENKVSATRNLTLIAAAISNEAEQYLNALTLVATLGDLLILDPIRTRKETVLIAEKGGIDMTASIEGGKKLLAYGKEGITTSPHETPLTLTDINPDYLAAHPYSLPDKLISPITLAGSEVYMKSDAGMDIAGTHFEGSKINLIANGNILFYSVGQASKLNSPQLISSSMLGDEINVKANNFFNNAGWIQGDTVSYQLTGNLYNTNQGRIIGDELLYIEAKNVYNQCQVQKAYNGYAFYDTYLPSVIQGGTGKNHDGVGLYIKTSEKVINDASIIKSEGSNVILAKGGFESNARSNTYVAYSADHKGLFSKTHEERIETEVGYAGVISDHGQNIISSENGGIKTVATLFSAEKGTYLSAKDKVELYDLVIMHEEKKDKKTAGLFYNHEKRYDEAACPTLLLDQTGISIVCQSDILTRGMIAKTPGHFHEEGKTIIHDTSVLKHTFEQKSFGMHGSLGNVPIYSLNSPGNCKQPFWNGDPTFNQFQALSHSQGALEMGLNSGSAGISLLNTANALVNGMRTGTLLLEALKQEFPSIYAPQLGMNFTYNHTKASSESLGPGGIYAGSADLKGERIIFKGAPLKVAEDLEVTADYFAVEGKTLNSSFEQKTKNLNFSISAVGDPYQVGGSSSHNQTTAHTEVNNQVQVGGTTTLHVNHMVLDGSVLTTGEIAGEVDKLTMISRLDEVSCKNNNSGISTGGNFCYSQQTSSSQTLNEAAGIKVNGSINEKPGEFKVHTLESTGGQIIANGQNNFKADTIISHPLEQKQTSSGFSVGGNVKNFINPDTQTNHLLPNDKQSRQITTTDGYISNSQYCAHTGTVIYGGQGTNVSANQVIGDIHTTSPDGTVVDKNSSHNYHVAVPHMDEPTKTQFEANAKWVASKFIETEQKVKRVITDFFKPPEIKSEEKVYYHHGNGKWYFEEDDNKDHAPVKDLNDAYNQGKVAAINGRIPSDIESWPDELQANFYMGMGEIEGTKLGIKIGAGFIASGIASFFATAEFVGAGLLSLGMRTFGLFKATENMVETSYEIIARISKEVSEMNLENLLEYLTPAEKNAYRQNPQKGSRFLGQAIHRGTDEQAELEFPDRFKYNLKGPDFLDKLTKEYVELTTPGCKREHELRYPGIEIVTYTMPKF